MRKLLAAMSVLVLAATVQPAKAETKRLDCIAPQGVLGGGEIGWSVTIDYSASKIVWFGFLSGNGSLDDALLTDAPAQITDATISWVRHTTMGDSAISVNRSTGTLYFESATGNSYTAQCHVYTGAPPPIF